MSDLAIVVIAPDGTAVLEDGREVKLVVTRGGLIGAKTAPARSEREYGSDRAYDQVGANPPPTLEGLDQVG